MTQAEFDAWNGIASAYAAFERAHIAASREAES
jgi:hypothetical protein